MSKNKVWSKSIGRNPSFSLKSLNSFKSKVLKHVGKEYLNIDSAEEELEHGYCNYRLKTWKILMFMFSLVKGGLYFKFWYLIGW